MKNKIALASALLATTSYSFAEIVINEYLSFEGFVDMSYVHTDLEADGSNSAAPGFTADYEDAENSYAIDQVEISWLFDFNPVTAQIDLEYEEAGDGLEVEQAFATYHFDNGGAITAGRYASMLGFEAFEPTGLYQYSFAYDMEFGDVSVLPGYAQGVKFTYEGDNTFFGISLQDEAYDLDGGRLGGDDETLGDGVDSSYAVEIAGSIAMDNGLSFFLGGVYEDGDDAAGADADSYAINAYTTFETGNWIFAAEANYGSFDGGAALAGISELLDTDVPADPAELGLIAGDITGQMDEDVMQILLMANFAYSENASITGRFSYSDHEADAMAGVTPLDLEGEFFKYTIAHGYAFTDNLFLVAELSYVDGEFEASAPINDVDYDVEGLEAALELIFTF